MYRFLHSLVALAIIAGIATPAARAEPGVLETMLVTATRSPTPRRDLIGDVTLITRDEIERAGQTSLAEVLQAQPGIEMARTGGAGKTTGVFLRGANDTQTVILIDGVRVNSASTGQTSLQHIPLGMIDHVEILRGPASSLYGADAIGGVIQIFTRRAERPELHASAGVGSYGRVSGAVGGSTIKGPLSLSFDLGHTSENGFSAIRNPTNVQFNPDRDGYRDTHATFTAALKVSDAVDIGANVMFSNAVNWFDSGGASPAANPTRSFDFRAEETLVAGSGHLRAQMSPEWTSLLRLSRGEDDLTSPRRNSTNTLTVNDVFHTVQDQITWQNDIRAWAGTFTAGVERVDQHVLGTTAFPVAERRIDSWFGGWRGTLGDHLLQVNARQDRNSQFGKRNTHYLGWAWNFDRAWQASLGAGTAFNAPTFNQLYAPSFGVADLRPERARNLEAGLRYARAGSEVSLVTYRNRVDNLIQNVATPAGIRPQNVALARLQGTTLEYVGKHDTGILKASLDLQSPRDEGSGRRLARRSRVHGAVSASTQVFGWTIGAEATGADARFSDGLNQLRMGGYGLVNLSAATPIGDGWTLLVRGDNIFNKRYELVADFATPAATLFVGVSYASR